MARTSAAPTVALAAAHRLQHRTSRCPTTLPALPFAEPSSGQSRGGAENNIGFARVPGWSECLVGLPDGQHRPQRPQHIGSSEKSSGNAATPRCGLPELPRAELPAASTETPSDVDSAIFDIEVEDSCAATVQPSSCTLEHAAEHKLQSTVTTLINTARSPYDCQLRTDATELACALREDLSHSERVTALADQLEARGYVVSVRTSAASYAPSTLEFNLRHVFLSCQPPPEAEDRQPRIVDPSFKDQFHIANPSPGYKAVLKAVPMVFVGSVTTLQSMIERLCSQMSDSFKVQAMPIPPWRRAQALYSKWFPSDPSLAHQRHLLPR